MIKDKTSKALNDLTRVIDEWKYHPHDLDSYEQAIYKIYDEAENFVKAFRKNELKIDD